MRRSVLCAAACLSAAAIGCRSQGGSIAPAVDFRTVRSSVANQAFHGDSLTVEHLRLGALDTIPDTLRFDITNRSGSPRRVGVSIRTEAGLWVLTAWQRTFAIELQAGERRSVAVPYVIRRLTPAGKLRLTFGTAKGDSAPISVVNPVINQQFSIGAGNPAAVDPRRNADHLRTTHLDVYAFRSSLAARDMRRIGRERERAISQIENLLATRFTGRVTLVFYPDSATKRNETGHIGMGYASNELIVEIYNERQRLDPFHELVHIIAGQVGDPPALFDEGFAVYATELLGADALQHLGHAGRTVDQAACDLKRAGKRIPLDSLILLTEFGSAAAPGDVTYPQGASVVKYLIETYGLERFRDAYRTLPRAGPNVGETFTQIFSSNPAALESAWYLKIGCST